MKNILIVIPSLKLWWWAEKVAAKIWSKFYGWWYTTKYITFYNVDKKYNFSWEEYCLNENLEWNVVSKFFKLFSRAYQIKKFCKKNKIDTIFSFIEDANFPSIVSKLLWNRAKINISIRHSISDYWKWIYYRLIKLLYKYADNIIVLTQFEKNNLIKTFNIKEKKIRVIPNAIDIDIIEEQKNQDLWEYKNLFDTNKFTFITVWRLHKVKNQELIIKCFNKLNDKYPNIQLLILWDWELRDQLENLSNKNVHFLWIQENPYKFLSKSNCFLLSSLNEAFPNTMLEAMACWLPIISTEAQWPNEILDNWKYWILVKNNAEDDFYNAMKKIFLYKNYCKDLSTKMIKRIKLFKSENIIKKRENTL